MTLRESCKGLCYHSVSLSHSSHIKSNNLADNARSLAFKSRKSGHLSVLEQLQRGKIEQWVVDMGLNCV